MAHTIKDCHGATSTQTPSGTAGQAYVLGPPSCGGAHRQGRFILESVSGSNTTYRWIADETIAGNTPSTYRFTPNH